MKENGLRSVPATGLRPRRSVGWIAFAAFWTAFAVLLAAPRVLLHRDSAGPATWVEALPIALLDMYSWSLVALAAYWLAQRIPLDREGWVRAAVVHFGAGLGILLLRFSAANAAAPGPSARSRSSAASRPSARRPRSSRTTTSRSDAGLYLNDSASPDRMRGSCARGPVLSYTWRLKYRRECHG